MLESTHDDSIHVEYQQKSPGNPEKQQNVILDDLNMNTANYQQHWNHEPETSNNCGNRKGTLLATKRKIIKVERSDSF